MGWTFSKKFIAVELSSSTPFSFPTWREATKVDSTLPPCLDPQLLSRLLRYMEHTQISVVTSMHSLHTCCKSVNPLKEISPSGFASFSRTCYDKLWYPWSLLVRTSLSWSVIVCTGISSETFWGSWGKSCKFRVRNLHAVRSFVVLLILLIL